MIVSYFYFYLTWKSKIFVSVARICAHFYDRLILYFQHPHSMHVYNGPGVHSDLINLYNKPIIHLSSFQAYVVLYANSLPNNLFHVELSKYSVFYASNKMNQIKIHISNSTFLQLPPCTNTVMSNKKLWTVRNLLKNNQHCVYHLTSETGYVNLSITKLEYIGYDLIGYKRAQMYQCAEGGVAINRILGHRIETFVQ